MSIEMIEPTVPAEQPATQPTQGATMNNLIGIITQALESHINELVDKRLRERLAEPNMDEIKAAITDMIDEKFAEHTNEYDHDEYDQTVRTVNDAELDDFEDKIKYILRGVSITLDL